MKLFKIFNFLNKIKHLNTSQGIAFISKTI